MKGKGLTHKRMSMTLHAEGLARTVPDRASNGSAGRCGCSVGIDAGCVGGSRGGCVCSGGRATAAW